jgi:UDP-N-acetylmuramyl pentapeptide phosphotransferase/UDP-N-acetylglucosamine-1-phosphate transferase
VPRSGGIAIAAGVSGALVLTGHAGHWALLIALALVPVSFLDDLFGLPALLRLSFHLVAAAALLAALVPQLPPIAMVLLFFSVAWLTNLYNFMDGSDGLAGGMTVAGFGACAVAAQSDGVVWLATICSAISASALAFLYFNFSPARIFMGDSGSIPLGFLTAAVGIAGWQTGIWELWFPLLVFSPFVVDATLTLCKRSLRGESIWRAHREHYYQRLVRMGLGHRNTALAEYALMAICAGAALAIRNATPFSQAAAVGACAAGYLVLAMWIDARWARHAADRLA